SFFDDRQKKIDFLLKLKEQGRSFEAMLLCCCYIEGLANSLYWPCEKSKENFVIVLECHGEEEILTCIHTTQLKKFLESSKASKSKTILKKVSDKLDSNANSLHTKDNILSILKKGLERSEYQWLSEKLWHGTVAAIIYTKIRCQLVHNLITSDHLSFDKTTYNGQSIRRIDFDFMYPVLWRILKKAKKISLSSGKWYGHDFKNNIDMGNSVTAKI
ncbi:MAG: hypothetical protein ACE5DO_15805, partial [Desulfobacterales bacterium]